MNEAEFQELQRALNRAMEQQNRRPVPEFDRLSPLIMHQLLYHPFKENSPIRFRQAVSDEVLIDGCPFLKLTLRFLQRLADVGEEKLTAKGNLNRKLCLEIYDWKILPEEYIEKGWQKLNKEGDSVVLQNLRIISDLARLTKKRKGKLSLTATGKKMLSQPYSLFVLLFQTHARAFNWAYHDVHMADSQLQHTFGFLLYLLIRYGAEEKTTFYYSQKHARAFPMVYEQAIATHSYGTPEYYYDHIFQIRIYQRFMNYFGLIYFRQEGMRLADQVCFIQTTELFQALFSFDVEQSQGK